MTDRASPLAVSPTEASKLLGIGRSTLYKLFADGSLVPVKLGSRTLVRYDDLTVLLDHQATRTVR